MAKGVEGLESRYSKGSEGTGVQVWLGVRGTGEVSGVQVLNLKPRLCHTYSMCGNAHKNIPVILQQNCSRLYLLIFPALKLLLLHYSISFT